MRPLLMALAVTAALAGCVNNDPAPIEAAAPLAPSHVQALYSLFTPEVLRVAAGTTVTWTNHDEVKHSVTPTDAAGWGTRGSGDEDTKWLAIGETWSHAFAHTGTFEYYCIPHALRDDATGEWRGMVGRVVVL